jgi:hypothetical protein
MRAGGPVAVARSLRASRSSLTRAGRWALHVPLLIILLLSPSSGAQAAPGSGDPGGSASRSGWLTVTWGDGGPGSGSTAFLVMLVDEVGESTVLEIEPRSLGQALGLNRMRVVASGKWADALRLAKQVLRVSSLQLDEMSGALSAAAPYQCTEGVSHGSTSDATSARARTSTVSTGGLAIQTTEWQGLRGDRSASCLITQADGGGFGSSDAFASRPEGRAAAFRVRRQPVCAECSDAGGKTTAGIQTSQTSRREESPARPGPLLKRGSAAAVRHLLTARYPRTTCPRSLGRACCQPTSLA